ncbi:tetratricopeptide repeat protein [Methylovirgula sp. 4M-Z18]|uniref:tetratricopeptide repeat protein n=1 Tax=Methylovirgula sp. 4M-Z18 TaxID=2293567 RepID=UPI000E2F8E29|nr:tetratricopeptide repeat protein [Methylovirgula sp. 4M-Z18]
MRWALSVVICVLLTMPAASSAQDVTFGLRPPLNEHERAVLLAKGTPEELFNAGVAYENGRGASHNDTLAAQFYRAAAERGYARAQVNLGKLYSDGQDVSQDYAEVRSWFERAADQGSAEAQYGLGLLYFAKNSVPKDEAQALVWAPKVTEQGLPEAQSNVAFAT